MVTSQLEDTLLSPATHRDIGTPTRQPVKVSALYTVPTPHILLHSSSSVPCSRMSLPANVITNTSSNAPGITVQFSCNNGGNISGNIVISCLCNGSWSGSVPTCVGGSTGESLVPLSNCCQITYLPNILLCPDDYHGYFGCYSYYSLPSLSSLVACSPLSTSANVSMNTSSTAPGVTVQFYCANGGSVSGNAVISCLLNGSWSGPVPSCIGGSTGESSLIPIPVLSQPNR